MRRGHRSRSRSSRSPVTPSCDRPASREGRPRRIPRNRPPPRRGRPSHRPGPSSRAGCRAGRTAGRNEARGCTSSCGEGLPRNLSGR
ncbi:hypothetical protein C1854_03810 [Eggerthella lenta]|uniref:Uncharacterized protein n=1 Tax=Eggerthella lenta TaxID=84112 RepID=A0A369MSP5_EGGLN|nr:hypothetical protein C1872_10510 [Eggerthella lenta]RDB98404.1 hypothetical protein C1865_13620 [Eggerthella lenta]RDC08502.1 hypothetical protein C1863_00835 [Eggerthella lenta]RDC13571.1 hypothetical protein C1860_08740 [Eggerthella lenta]RDC19380.1 hypothetical protein C1858_12230 [Eggerthella lenta]